MKSSPPSFNRMIWRSMQIAAFLLLAVSGARSSMVCISDVSPPRSILNGLESLVDVDTLDDLKILRHSTTIAHFSPESYENANEFYGGPHQFKRNLQPRFKVHSTKSGFILTAATPGLRRDEMSIEVVDDSDGHALNIQCKQCHNTTPTDEGNGTFPYALGGWQNCWSRDLPVSSVLPLRPPRRDDKYPDFKRRIPIPNCYNMSSLLARFEDGLLVVSTTPLAETERDAAV